MPSARQGTIRLFRFAGIDVFLHWSWFLVAAYEIQLRKGQYSSITWNVLEYLALFLIVTLHEFGHSLACRQVGGQAKQIVLWPLGGVAYVDPPPRPGATLWSLAAGPLVNVALLPILYGLAGLSRSLGWAATMPNAHAFLWAVFGIDVVLLVFNMLPIYPLDGGQILRALLWFVMGRARSLMVATILGFVGIAGFVGLAFWAHSIWYGALAVFMLLNCWSGLRHAQALLRFAKLPRREGLACPACKAKPPIGDFWKCGKCGQAFDTFQTQAICPNCATHFAVTKCLDCGAVRPISEWFAPAMSLSSTFTAPTL
jgi:Zn-dependent protease